MTSQRQPRAYRGMSNINSVIDRLLAVNDKSQPSLTYCLSEDDVIELIKDARMIFSQQPVMLELEAPIEIVGDIHGQFNDLLRVFSKAGWPPDVPYLFLGDYVDRGKQQLETILLLICYKIKYKDAFFLLRGNHECSSINRTYGFYEEVKRRYSEKLYDLFQSMFNMMPITAIISGRILCMHGGLSPELHSWNDLRTIARPLEPAQRGLATDLLWADPEENVRGWNPNTRGISYTFGPMVVHQFCKQMDIDLIARAHQVVQDGFEFFAQKRLVTIFSAPRFCGEFDNNAATMHVSDVLRCSFKVIQGTDEPVKIRSSHSVATRSSMLTMAPSPEAPVAPLRPLTASGRSVRSRKNRKKRRNASKE